MLARELLEKNNLNSGDLVLVRAGDESYEGYLIPSNDDFVTLKLRNGYNAGIAARKIKEIKKLEGAARVGKPEAAKLEKKAALPTISILHTGGTIVSRVDYRTGAVVSTFTPEDLVAMFPELNGMANFNSALISNMWSDDLRFAHFGVIADAVKREVERGADGIIIGMGTDNMAVAAAAMAFVLEQCHLAVIFVGAQRSSDRGSSDAAMNLICAARFITKTDFAGVAICMHESSSDDFCAVLPACKTRKMHSSRRDAFRAINDESIARVNYKTGEIEFLKKDYARKDKNKKLLIKPNFEERTGFLKIHINMFPEEFEFYLKNNYKGLVIEGTGLGHTPGHVPNELCKIHEKFFPILKRLTDSGCVAVMTTQTLYGRVHMHVYDKGADLLRLGIIPGEDMLPETAFVKLAWLLGNYNPEKARELIAENLRGEISKCTRIESSFGYGP